MLSRVGMHLKGHVLLFDRRPAVRAYDEATGLSLLLIVVLLETLRATHGFVGSFFGWFAPLWLRLPALLALALLSIRVIARVPFVDLGFRPWRAWSTVERSYFVQALLIANAVFLIAFRTQLRAHVESGAATDIFWGVFVPYLFYGFYQEVLYRGILQTELIARWGAGAGILISNLVYTFGPLHMYYFAARTSIAVPMFAAIFAMGLLFGLIYRRSGNLWIPAVMHAVGNAYMVTCLGTLT